VNQQGIFYKYKIERMDGQPLKPGFRFVLSPESDPAALEALKAYADNTSNKQLSDDIRAFVTEIERRNRQKMLYEDRYKADIESGDADPWNELAPEEQVAVCEVCGDIQDPEMPLEEGETVFCGGDECLNS